MALRNNNLWSKDIVCEIALFFDNIIDIINFAQSNKTFYHWIFNNEVNLLFNQFQFSKIPSPVPSYFSLLNKLVLTLEQSVVISDELNKLINLEELIITLAKINNSNIEIDCKNLKLENFKNLKKLNLSFVKELPISFNSLENTLEELNISGTNVTDDKIKCLKKLTVLIVSDCKDLNGNCLQSLTNLKHLNLNGTDIDEKYLIYLSNLEYLNLSNSKYLGTYLPQLINLKTIIINNNTNYKGNNLENLTKLEELVINKFAFWNSSVVLDNEFKLPVNIKRLKLVHISVTDNHLQNLQKLEELDLCDCKEFIGTCLKDLKNLKVLKCSNLQLNDAHLQYCTQLTSLNLDCCSNIKGSCFKQLVNLNRLEIKTFHNTKGLWFSVNNITNNISDIDLQNLQNLKSLSLINCESINGDCFKYLSNLTSLDCMYSKGLKDENLKYLPNLTHLSIRDDIDEEYIKEFKQLKKLSILICNGSRFNGSCVLFENLKTLKEVQLGNDFDGFTILKGSQIELLKQRIRNKLLK